MAWSLADIWRHPIKGIGAERLTSVSLIAGHPVPLDRAWAVLEAGGETGEGWRACRNFLRGAKGPSLMAITARVDQGVIHLSHPERPDLAVDPASDAAFPALQAWLAPIYPTDRPPPVALERAPAQGLTDAPFPSVAVLNTASLRALSQRLGQPLDQRRFRGNLWLDGLAPWEEFDLVNKTLAIGDARLDVVEPITRCRATEANPDTGRRDAATLQALRDGWDHTDFGVYAQVRVGGDIAVGDTVTCT